MRSDRSDHDGPPQRPRRSRDRLHRRGINHLALTARAVPALQGAWCRCGITAWVASIGPKMSRWGRKHKVERLRERGDVPRLVEILNPHGRRADSDVDVGRRIEAVRGLGTIKSSSGEEGVIRALADPDPRVRHAAVEALRPTPSGRAVKALARVAATWRHPAFESAREAALALLLEVGDELAAVEYAQVLVSEERRPSLTPEEQSAVRRLFTADGGPGARVFAHEQALALGTAAEPERRVIYETLVAMGEVSVGPLISALDDPARRPLAASALGALRDTAAVPPLVHVLSTADATARAAAACALGEIRDPGALEALVRASGDSHPHVRDAAQDALDRMRGVLLAMAGAAPFLAEQGRNLVGPPDGTADAGAPRLAATSADPRSTFQRLLGRQRLRRAVGRDPALPDKADTTHRPTGPQASQEGQRGID